MTQTRQLSDKLHLKRAKWDAKKEENVVGKEGAGRMDVKLVCKGLNYAFKTEICGLVTKLID